MKIFSITLIAIGLRLIATAQNVVQVEYYLDTDAGVGRNAIIDVTPSPDGNFSFAVNPGGAEAGYHHLYMRIKDDKGKWSLVSRKYIEVLPVEGKKTVVSGEYFFNRDPGTGNAMPITVSPQDSIIMQNFTAVVAGLAPGTHRLYTRSKDGYGKWSLPSRTTVEIIPVETQNQVVTGEYFIDEDPGFGAGRSIPVSPKDSAITQSFTAGVSALKPGTHKLYGRWRDTYGKWSKTTRRIIEVIKNPDTSYIVFLEYFFKTDPGFGNANPVRLAVPVKDGEFSFNVPKDKIPPGIMDTLFVRARDSTGANWSLTQWKAVPGPGMPLTLLNFNAVRQDQSVLLDWQTENEVNTGYFYVQRSADRIHFTDVGRVNAKGYSITRSTYHYTDNIAGINAEKLYYRLKETDRDGKVIYSHVAAVHLEALASPFSIMPNPANKYITVMVPRNNNRESATIIIADIRGRTLLRQKAGNSTTISLSGFAKGVYTVSLITQGAVQTKKLVIQ